MNHGSYKIDYKLICKQNHIVNSIIQEDFPKEINDFNNFILDDGVNSNSLTWSNIKEFLMNHPQYNLDGAIRNRILDKCFYDLTDSQQIHNILWILVELFQKDNNLVLKVDSAYYKDLLSNLTIKNSEQIINQICLLLQINSSRTKIILPSNTLEFLIKYIQENITSFKDIFISIFKLIETSLQFPGYSKDDLHLFISPLIDISLHGNPSFQVFSIRSLQKICSLLPDLFFSDEVLENLFSLLSSHYIQTSIEIIYFLRAYIIYGNNIPQIIEHLFIERIFHCSVFSYPMIQLAMSDFLKTLTEYSQDACSILLKYEFLHFFTYNSYKVEENLLSVLYNCSMFENNLIPSNDTILDFILIFFDSDDNQNLVHSLTLLNRINFQSPKLKTSNIQLILSELEESDDKMISLLSKNVLEKYFYTVKNL